MLRIAGQSPPFAREVIELLAPQWAQDLVADSPDRFRLVTKIVRGVIDLPPADFEQQTAEAYASIGESLEQRDRIRHAVRFWNHVPFITDPSDGGRDNYMVFNAGRFRALSEWLGGPAQFPASIATASATGHWGRDLIIHCLASDTPGVAVNNPRQVAPYHYSQRFGPLPPCFARATRLDNMLLVGGTASVRGEDSVHVDELHAQIHETLLNMAALVTAAAGKTMTRAMKLPPWLGLFADLRIYFPNRDDEKQITDAVAAAFPNARRMELLVADLCRPELLVEIEGIANLAALRENDD